MLEMQMALRRTTKSVKRGVNFSMNPKITSAGGLVVRYRDLRWETALVGSGTPTVWRIPKGMQVEGEAIEQTAVREVREESGLDGAPLELIGTGSWTYQYGGRDRDKTCYYFLMRCIGGDINDHDEEYDQIDWFGLEDSVELLYYTIEKEIALDAVVLLKKYRPADFI